MTLSLYVYLYVGHTLLFMSSLRTSYNRILCLKMGYFKFLPRKVIFIFFFLTIFLSYSREMCWSPELKLEMKDEGFKSERKAYQMGQYWTLFTWEMLLPQNLGISCHLMQEPQLSHWQYFFFLFILDFTNILLTGVPSHFSSWSLADEVSFLTIPSNQGEGFFIFFVGKSIELFCFLFFAGIFVVVLNTEISTVIVCYLA